MYVVQKEVLQLILALFLSFVGWHLCLEQFLFLGAPLYQIGDISDCIHQLWQVGLIVIVLGLFVVRSCGTVQRGCSVESVEPVWILTVSCHLVVPVTWGASGQLVTSQTGRFTVSNGFQLSPTQYQSI